MPDPQLDPQPDETQPTHSAIVTWKGDARQDAVNAFAKAIQAIEPVARKRPATASGLWLNQGPGGSTVRDGYDRQDYDELRPEESIPDDPKAIMALASAAYEKTGIIRNVFDLMADFSIKGIGLEHAKDAEERFYKAWWRKVQGYERSAHFMKCLFLHNVAIVRRHTGKLPRPTQKKWLRTAGEVPDGEPVEMEGGDPALAEPDVEPLREGRVPAREIPLRYSFLNPLSVDLTDERAATFLGPESFRFSLRVPPDIARRVRFPKGPQDEALVAALPHDIRRALQEGATGLPLDPDKVSAFYFKRDDWKPWPTPYIRSVLGDLQTLEKMKLADLAALDGVISSIRVWKLGSLAEGIYPPEAVLARLAEILTSNVGGGVMDLVWGPDIELIETSTAAHEFLGDAKYAPVLNAIFQGLGIPATLNGTGQRPNSGYTNNYMSLKTFVERLEYGRMVLRQFWEGELRRVQLAMGHARPASLYFDSVLTDEATMMRLYLDMADRDLLSAESLQEIFGIKSEVESVRLRKELAARKAKRTPTKASPYHDANLEGGLWKILAQTGQYGPSELGLEAHEKEEGESPPAERGAKIAKKHAPKPAGPAATPGGKPGGKEPAPKGEPGEGRPPGKKDAGPRKQKVVRPRSGAPSGTPSGALSGAGFVAGEGGPAFFAAVAQARARLDEIHRETSPVYLRALGKKTERELTDEESAALEAFRFSLLARADLAVPVTGEAIRRAVALPLPPHPFADALLRRTLARHRELHGRGPTFEATRHYMAMVRAACGPDECGAGECGADQCGADPAEAPAVCIPVPAGSPPAGPHSEE